CPGGQSRRREWTGPASLLVYPCPLAPLHVCGTRCVKDVHKLPVATANFSHSGLPRDLLRTPLRERLPETRPAHGEAHEPRDSGRRGQPCAHSGVVLTPAQDDAADFIPTA